MSNIQALIDAFDQHYAISSNYQYMQSVASFDQQTIAPKNANAVNHRSKAFGFFALKSFEHNTSEDYKQLVADLEAVQDQLSPVMKRRLQLVRKELDVLNKIDPQEYQAYAMLLTKAQVAWEEAKESNNFAHYAPYLEDILGYVRKFAGYRQTTPGPLYNVLLDEYEEGSTMALLDGFFSTLRKRIVPLLQKIQASNVVIKDDFLSKHYPKNDQLAFAEYLLPILGYDLGSGALAQSAHPFSSSLSPYDVRVTTHVYEDNFASSLFSTAHEAGHGIYEQNIGDALKETNLGGGAAMSIHESQSRFYENIVGRSLGFLKTIYPALQEQFPSQLQGVTVEEFYKAINQAKTSFIRTESDELTYSLHIMIRYELEKQLISGTLAVKDLPAAWNKLYEEYLGITPPNDKLGCLQDVHWSGGAFGYFPSYALGNAISMQLVNKMNETINVDQIIASGKLDPLKEWFTNNIYVHGKLYPPFELLEKVTGEPLNPNYYCDYLEAKFGAIYHV
jgi:carboxypeptidase Taq